jgi:hypothetical protein
MNASATNSFESRPLRIAACVSWVLLPLFFLIAGTAGPAFALSFAVLPVWVMMGLHGAYYVDLLRRGFGWSNACMARFGGAMLAATCIACWCAGLQAGLTTGLGLTLWVAFSLAWTLSTSLALGYTSLQTRGLLFLLVFSVPLWLAGMAWWSFRLVMSRWFPEAGSPIGYCILLIMAAGVLITGLVFSWRARRAVRAIT